MQLIIVVILHLTKCEVIESSHSEWLFILIREIIFEQHCVPGF